MHLNELEKAFGDFLERREYDEVQSALFSMVRMSFVAGWLAAGGDPPQPQKIFTLIPPPVEPEDKTSNCSEEEKT